MQTKTLVSKTLLSKPNTRSKPNTPDGTTCNTQHAIRNTPARHWLIAFAITLLLAVAVNLSLSAQPYNSINFGYGRGVQLVDPAGGNKMPFWSGQSSLTVDFALYPLTHVDFVKRMAIYDPYAQTSVSTAGLTASATWQQTLGGSVNPWDPQFVTLPAGTASGIYVIKASHASAGTDAEYVIVGRNGMLLKKAAGGQIVAWVSTLRAQTAAPGLAVTVYDKQGNSLAQTNTDGSGVAKVTLNSGEPFMAIAQGSGEVALSGMDWNWTTDGYYWWWDWSGSQSPSKYSIYLYSDRPIYRPSQTIYYQAFVRQRELNGYSGISPSTPISVTLRDSRNNLLSTQAVSADEFGAVHGEFALGDQPSLGWYTLALNLNGQTQTQRLRVEAYRKPEYQVTVSTASEHTIGNDSIPVTVAADYYFGQPVAGAKVKLKIFRYTIPRYGWYWWSNGNISPYYNTPVGELSGTTGADGKWTGNVTPEVTDQYDALYTFEAEVTDARNLPVSGSKQVSVHWNTFEMSIMPKKWGFQTNEAVQMDIRARTWAQTPAAGKNVTVRIIRDYWDQTPESDAVPPQNTVTDGNGNAQVTFNSVPQGWYRIEATSTDERGRKVLAVNYLWVFDPQANSWYYFNDNELSILADKESYLPGDTAHLLIQSKVNGLALLTLERDGVYQEKVVTISGPVTNVDLPITADFAPNVFAKVHLFKATTTAETQSYREGRFLVAQTELVVPATDKKLTVSIAPASEKYRPGEMAAIALQVTDANGQPVRARVGIALVDEAIYALQADLSANLFDTFWGRRANGVITYDSLARQPYGYSTAAPLPTSSPAPSNSPVPEGITDKQSSNATQVRRRFEDTAYWNATLTTGDDGKLTVNVPLPDNLTTWRIIIKAIAVDSKVGSGQSKLLVTQEIIARPALPRFGVVGDRFQTGVVAQNFSGSDTTGSASMVAQNLVLIDGGARNLNLPNGGSGAVNWTAVAAQNGTGLVSSTVQTGNGGDIVELPLPIKPFAVPDRWLASGQANLSASEPFNVPLNAVTEQTKLEVRLSPSLALGVLDGLDELIDYPYGCVEQTMSRLLPTAVAAKAYTDLGLPNPKAGDVPKIVEQGLQKVYGFQHSDGSWGWFYDDTGAVFLTSYVLFGLTSVEKAGFAVDAKVVTSGFAFLDGQLTGTNPPIGNQPKPIDPGVRAFALYVKALAGRGDLAAAQALINQTESMDASQVAALALALHLGNDGNNANTVIDKLVSLAKDEGATVFWPLFGDPWDYRKWQTMASDEKNTALALRALTTIRPTSALIPEAVRWLLENRKGPGWGNTQATSFAVLGLVDVIKANGELQSNYSYTVKLNGQAIASGQVTPQTATQPIAPIKLAGNQLLAGDNTLLIERTSGTGSLYYTALLQKQLYYDSFTQVSSLDQGVSINRSYKLHEGTPRNDGAYNVGDLVEVTLKVNNARELWYVLISDPIPAGFEVVQERMNPVVFFDYFPLFLWEGWGYNMKEAHDDRVEYFVTNLWKGEHTYTYLMRANTPGEFSVLPGTITPMYNESIWGRTSSQLVKIAPERLATAPQLLGDFDRSCNVTSFDANLVAAAWNTGNTQRDVTSDGKVDLRDVAAVGSWKGTACGTQRSLPSAGNGNASFSVSIDKSNAWVAEEVRATVSINSLSAADVSALNLGGFGLKLNLSSSALSVKRIEVNPALGSVLPLGPHSQNGVVSVGLYGLPANLAPGTQLITVVFSGSGVGDATVTAGAAEAVDGAGGLINASANGSGVVKVDGFQSWLPVVGK